MGEPWPVISNPNQAAVVGTGPISIGTRSGRIAARAAEFLRIQLTDEAKFYSEIAQAAEKNGINLRLLRRVLSPRAVEVNPL